MFRAASLLVVCILGPALVTPLRVMSYNLYGWNALVQNPWKADNIYNIIRTNNPDILGCQEVEGKHYDVAANVGMSLIGDGYAGLAIFYNPSQFTLIDNGIELIYEMDQWGQRAVMWAHLDNNGQRVDFFNTHLCVCGEEDLFKSAKRLVEVISMHRSSPDSIVYLTGDFNVFPGFEYSKPIRYLKGEEGNNIMVLEDTFRVADPNGDGSTFGAAGKIDYVFTNAGRPVYQAWIDRGNYGEASDHYPVAADII